MSILIEFRRSVTWIACGPVLAATPMDQAVDEAQLPDDRRRQDEGVEVRLAHAVVEAVDRIGQREPGVDQRVEIGLAVGIEINRHLEHGFAADLGVDSQAEGIRRLQGIDDVKVVRPDFGEVFPGMGPAEPLTYCSCQLGCGPFA